MARSVVRRCRVTPKQDFTSLIGEAMPAGRQLGQETAWSGHAGPEDINIKVAIDKA